MSEQEPNSLLLLGEIRGQLRELIHTGNNNSAKIDALTMRIGALERANERSAGERSVWMAVIKSPQIAWIASGALALWAFLTGRLHP